MILKVADVRPLLTRARLDPASVMQELQLLAADDRWQTREVAATALVEIGKRHPEVVLHTSHAWAVSDDENVRRAAIEGLRGLARTDLRRVLPVLELLRADVSTYVKKAVANVPRNEARMPVATVSALVKTTCARAGSASANTRVQRVRPRRAA